MGRYKDYKCEVVKISRRLADQGYFGPKSGTAGNVSVRIEGEDAVAVTPTQMRYDLMTADDVCIVDFELEVIEGARKPSMETPMHVAAYRGREDVGAVIHTHQTYASVMSVLNAPIPPLFDEVALAIGDSVDIVPYAPCGTQELHQRVARALGNRCQCYLIQNHGAVCVGRDLETTFTYVELLEKIATVYVTALATGRPITTLPKAVSSPLSAAVAGRQHERPHGAFAKQSGKGGWR